MIFISRSPGSISHHLHCYSARPTVLYTHYIIRLYFWPMDRRYYLLFRSPHGCANCIYHFSNILPRLHLAMALLHDHHQARRPCRRKAPQAPLPHPSSALPLQRDELSPGCIADAHIADLHCLHRTVAFQSHHTHQHGGINTLIQGLPPRRSQGTQRAARTFAHGAVDRLRHRALHRDSRIPVRRRAQGRRRRAGRRT